MTIAEATQESIAQFLKPTLPLLRKSASFEAAAQLLAERLATTFESISLARVFGTVDYRHLPQFERDSFRSPRTISGFSLGPRFSRSSEVSVANQPGAIAAHRAVISRFRS